MPAEASRHTRRRQATSVERPRQTHRSDNDEPLHQSPCRRCAALPGTPGGYSSAARTARPRCDRKEQDEGGRNRGDRATVKLTVRTTNTGTLRRRPHRQDIREARQGLHALGEAQGLCNTALPDSGHGDDQVVTVKAGRKGSRFVVDETADEQRQAGHGERQAAREHADRGLKQRQPGQHDPTTKRSAPGERDASYSGGRIRTCDLRVMSPTSYQTAPPRGVPTSLPTGRGRAQGRRRPPTCLTKAPPIVSGWFTSVAARPQSVSGSCARPSCRRIVAESK